MKKYRHFWAILALSLLTIFGLFYLGQIDFSPVTGIVTYVFGFSRILKLSRKELAEPANPSALGTKPAPSPVES
jgi:hypothetical protein